MLSTVIVASLSLFASPAPAPAFEAPVDHLDGTAARDLQRLRARLSGNGRASGQADYRETARGPGVVRSFSVEIERAAPNTTYDVLVGSAVIGRITTNALGTGDLNMRTVTDNPGQQGPVPDLEPGHVVRVRGLSISGVLR